MHLFFPLQPAAPPAPSAADLDAVEAERKIAAETLNPESKQLFHVALISDALILAGYEKDEADTLAKNAVDQLAARKKA